MTLSIKYEAPSIGRGTRPHIVVMPSDSLLTIVLHVMASVQAAGYPASVASGDLLAAADGPRQTEPRPCNWASVARVWRFQDSACGVLRTSDGNALVQSNFSTIGVRRSGRIAPILKTTQTAIERASSSRDLPDQFAGDPRDIGVR